MALDLRQVKRDCCPAQAPDYQQFAADPVVDAIMPQVRYRRAFAPVRVSENRKRLRHRDAKVLARRPEDKMGGENAADKPDPAMPEDLTTGRKGICRLAS